MVYLGTFEKKDKFYDYGELMKRFISHMKMVGFKNVTNILGSMFFEKKNSVKKNTKDEDEYRKMLFGNK